MANGFLTTVEGFGDIYFILFKSALHVPNLLASFFSIDMFTYDLECHVNFFPSYYAFKIRGGGLGLIRKVVASLP